jgi:hypothetical protein
MPLSVLLAACCASFLAFLAWLRAFFLDGKVKTATDFDGWPLAGNQKKSAAPKNESRGR